MKVALTVASSDTGCGAGVQADLLSFVENGVYGTMAIACLTAQNPNEVTSIQSLPTDFLKAQINAINDYYKIDAIKCGMLFSKDCIDVLVEFIKANPHINFVADTVMVATSKAKLLKDDAIKTLSENLLPLADIITPNLDEALVLLEREDIGDIFEASKELSKKYNTAVLLKGGHLQGDKITDVLCLKDGKIYSWECDRILNINTHGSGCTLSASICANLAKGFDILKSVELAREYLLKSMKNSLKINAENFINHIHK